MTAHADHSYPDRLMIDLASPYSHLGPDVREQRYRAAFRAAARLMRAGHVVFSPVAHGHAIGACGLPTDRRFWKPFDREQLARCDEVVVLMRDGWRESVGVQAEIRVAGELGKPVRYLVSGRVTLPVWRRRRRFERNYAKRENAPTRGVLGELVANVAG